MRFLLGSRGCGLALATVLLANTSVYAQNQASVPNPLSEAQALALLQTLAKGDKGGSALTAAQMQLLSQYMRQVSQVGASAQAASMLQSQALTAQTGTTPVPVPIPATALTPPGAGTGVGPKKSGITRIGVTEPKTQMVQGNAGTNVAEPLRAMLLQYLSGPAFEIIPVNAMLPSQIDAEVKQKDCDYVLYTSMSQKLNSGGMGMLHKALPMASMIPMLAPIGMAGAIAGGAASVAASGASSLAGAVKAKSEMTLDYKLIAPGATTPLLTNSAKAKAKEDGEDIITPLVAQAAGTILTELSKKK